MRLRDFVGAFLKLAVLPFFVLLFLDEDVLEDLHKDIFVFLTLVIEALVAYTLLYVELICPIVENAYIHGHSHRVVLVDFTLSELAFPLLVPYRRLDLASSQVCSALSEFDFLLSEENIGTDSVPLILSVGLHVFIAILALDRGLHLDGRSIGKPLTTIITILHLRFLHFLANSLIFLVKFPQLLHETVQIQRVNLLLVGLQL